MHVAYIAVQGLQITFVHAPLYLPHKFLVPLPGIRECRREVQIVAWAQNRAEAAS